MALKLWSIRTCIRSSRSAGVRRHIHSIGGPCADRQRVAGGDGGAGCGEGCNKATGGKMSQSLRDRFFAKVRQEDLADSTRCWTWIGSVHSKKYPYGSIYVDGASRRASQVSWELHHSM